MVAPKGRSYTPTRGPLAGQTFNAPANARGETAGYNAYQNALARHYGQPTYAALRAQRISPVYQNVFQRALNHDHGRERAHQYARDIVGNFRYVKAPRGAYAGGPTGAEMGRIVKAIYDQGLYDSGDDVAEDLYYE